MYWSLKSCFDGPPTDGYSIDVFPFIIYRLHEWLSDLLRIVENKGWGLSSLGVHSKDNHPLHSKLLDVGKSISCDNSSVLYLIVSYNSTKMKNYYNFYAE